MQMAATWRIAHGDLAAGSRARREFGAYLQTYATDPARQSAAELIFGELVANALKCSRTTVLVELYKDPSTLRVVDDGLCFDPVAILRAPIYSEGGRGIQIVKTLARFLTVEARDAWCFVTAILP